MLVVKQIFASGSGSNLSRDCARLSANKTWTQRAESPSGSEGKSWSSSLPIACVLAYREGQRLSEKAPQSELRKADATTQVWNGQGIYSYWVGFQNFHPTEQKFRRMYDNIGWDVLARQISGRFY